MVKKWLVIMLLFALFIPQAVAETDVYTIRDENGEVLTYICGECEAGDEYFSRDNQHYRIKTTEPDMLAAVAEHVGAAEMPDVSWLNMEQSQPVAALGQKQIALYCTHSDESYLKGDGTESVEGRGGIYDIAAAFAKEMEALGVEVDTSDATHLPHDAGAYRRSRQTASQLLKNRPNAIFDIHRDGIPDPDEYRTSIGNTEMSMVRLLVGKSNQNREANLHFAKQIKAVADKVYPGLIKDIYMGKGTYNQDLAPRSVLLEFGTHTLPKELVLRAVKPMSEVVNKTLFGGIIGSAGVSDASRQSGSRVTSEITDSETPAVQSSKGSSAAFWLIAAFIGGLGIFALLSTGGKGALTKWKRSISETTGGLFGKKPRGDQ